MWFFFASSSGEVPWAFKVCGIFQASCDLGLAVQYLVWGDGPGGKEGASPVPEYIGLDGVQGDGGVGLGVMGAEKVGIEMAEGHLWERPRTG